MSLEQRDQQLREALEFALQNGAGGMGPIFGALATLVQSDGDADALKLAQTGVLALIGRFPITRALVELENERAMENLVAAGDAVPAGTTPDGEQLFELTPQGLAKAAATLDLPGVNDEDPDSSVFQLPPERPLGGE